MPYYKPITDVSVCLRMLTFQALEPATNDRKLDPCPMYGDTVPVPSQKPAGNSRCQSQRHGSIISCDNCSPSLPC